MNITDYGWEIYCSAVNNLSITHTDDGGLCPGRVVTESSNMYRVYTDRGENWAVLGSGSLGRTPFAALDAQLMARVRMQLDWEVR